MGVVFRVWGGGLFGTYGREAMDWADRVICSRWLERNDMFGEGEGER